jgi:F0F1-type ATP synthase delta subunit
MKVPRNELVPVIAELSDKLPAKKLINEVAGYLLDANRTSELDSIARDLVDYRAEHGIVEVTAVSAHKLTESAIKEVKSKVKQIYPNARKIIINQQIDVAQIGGVRLEFPGRQLDLSLRAKVNKFKQLTAVNK